MKNYLFIFCLFITIGLNAQKKIFEEALTQPRQEKAFYTVYLQKPLEAENIVAYAQTNNYLLQKVKKVRLSNASSRIVVQSFEFLPNTEVEAYSYECTAGIIKAQGVNSPTIDKMKTNNTGTAFLYVPNTNNFAQFNNLYWTGAIQNGKLEGKGEGYLYTPSNNQKSIATYLFSGEFKQGVLQGEGIFTMFSFETSAPEYTHFFEKKIYISPFKEGIASIRLGGKYGFINENSQIIIPIKYSQVIQGFESGLAIVVSDDNKEIVINASGGFVEYSPKQKQIIQEAEMQRKKKEEERKAVEAQNTTYSSSETGSFTGLGTNNLGKIKYLHVYFDIRKEFPLNLLRPLTEGSVKYDVENKFKVGGIPYSVQTNVNKYPCLQLSVYYADSDRYYDYQYCNPAVEAHYYKVEMTIIDVINGQKVISYFESANVLVLQANPVSSLWRSIEDLTNDFVNDWKNTHK